MFSGEPPAWALRRPKPLLQSCYDLIGAPLRMVLFPDGLNERLHLTSLRAERLSQVLPALTGRVLDIGAGDNMLVRLYRQRAAAPAQREAAAASVGVDVVDWGGDCMILQDCRSLPFPDESFDTVTFVACLNHIPERREALAEARRVLRPAGQLIATMIGRRLGDLGHALWWYSEDKHRDVQEGEVMGIDPGSMRALLLEAGFDHVREDGFVYGLNHLYTARRAG